MIKKKIDNNLKLSPQIALFQFITYVYYKTYLNKIKIPGSMKIIEMDYFVFRTGLVDSTFRKKITKKQVLFNTVILNVVIDRSLSRLNLYAFFYLS